MGPERRSNGKKIPWLSFVCLQLCNVIQRTHACSRLSFHSFSVLPQTTTSSLNHAQKLFSSQFRSFVFIVQSCKRESAFPPYPSSSLSALPIQRPKGKGEEDGVWGVWKGRRVDAIRPSVDVGWRINIFCPSCCCLYQLVLLYVLLLLPGGWHWVALPFLWCGWFFLLNPFCRVVRRTWFQIAPFFPFPSHNDEVE